MFVFDRPDPYPDEPFGFDNGAFYCWRANQSFDVDAYMRRVERLDKLGVMPYLAVLPDVVGGGRASLDFSLSWIDQLPTWPLYLALQDGMTEDEVRSTVLTQPRIAGLFLGGTDKFKLGAYKWRNLTLKINWEHRPLRFHYARAGTLRKLDHAKQIHADSLDSAFPIWTEERFIRFIRAWAWDSKQQHLL